MPKIPYSGYNYPLGQKIEQPLIPVGFLELEKAIELLGRTMFPDEWTGEERGFFGTGAFGQKFKSKIELETDQAFRDMVLMTQCELECELYGGDPKQRYHLRTTPQNDDEPFVPMGDLPRLSDDEMRRIEGHFAEELSQAKAVRERREKAEDKFLRELLWPGSLKAHFLALDGRVLEIEQHTWGAPDGRRSIERGWIELPGDDGGRKVCSILINKKELDSTLPGASLGAKPAETTSPGHTSDNTVSKTSSRFSKAAVRVWYEKFIKTRISKGKKSTRDEDHKAARDQFEVAIPREFMRELRRELAPQEWTAKGAPKLAGNK